MVEHKEHMSIYMTNRLKRRLKDASKDKGISMNNFIIEAIQNEVDRYDASYSAPDLVLDRLSELLNAQIATATLMNKQTQAINNINETLDELLNREDLHND